MSRKKDGETDTSEEVTKVEPVVKVTPPPTRPVAQRPDKKPEVIMNFDRWFATTGRPVHHKAGMKVYRKMAIAGKRTAAAWDKLFKNY